MGYAAKNLLFFSPSEESCEARLVEWRTSQCDFESDKYHKVWTGRQTLLIFKNPLRRFVISTRYLAVRYLERRRTCAPPRLRKRCAVTLESVCTHG